MECGMGPSRRPGSAVRRAAVALALAVACAASAVGWGAPARAGIGYPAAIFANGCWVRLPLPPRLVEGRVVSPVRALVEALGGGVEWDAVAGRAVVYRGDLRLEIQAGSPQGTLAGKPLDLGLPASLYRGYLLAPVRPLMEALGVGIIWDDATQCLSLYTPDGLERAQEAARAGPWAGLSRDDVALLARVVYAEAIDEPFEGMVAVAAVVLNRVKSGRFPGTVAGVIFQPNQFKGVETRLFRLPPQPLAVRAALEALHGWDPSNGALFFFNPSKASGRFFQGRTVTAEIGHHRFLK
ncbi:MAG: cell wall hydrolase [Acetobacteraceae bacterium]|nr:cell wall hydrolase [Acetobacteraceae bacterium]